MAKTKSTPKKPLKTPLANSLEGIKKKRARKQKFAVTLEPDGKYKITGRPAFPKKAINLIDSDMKKKSKVDLDRRHLVHFDEELKPFGILTLNQLRSKYGDKTPDVIKSALSAHGVKNLRGGGDQIIKRLITEVNGSVMNLVPDDASINKAIEHVRANLREAVKDFNSHPEVREIFENLDKSNYGKATDMFKKFLASRLPVSGASKPITLAMQDINKEIINLVNAQSNILDLHKLVTDLQYSVTFDLCSKSVREKTAFALQWSRNKNALEARAKDERIPDELLSHLVAFIV